MVAGWIVRAQDAFSARNVWRKNPAERIFQKMKRLTNQFYNIFNHADLETTENWLRSLSWAWNQLI